MKPATRNGLTALIVILVATNVAVIVVRHGRDDRTRVSVAPAPPTTGSTTTVTTAAPITTSTSPTTAPATTATSGSAVPSGSADLGAAITSTVPATTVPATTAPATTVPAATTLPASDPTLQAPPTTVPVHPQTGGGSLSLAALLLIGVGLVGLQFARRAHSTSR